MRRQLFTATAALLTGMLVLGGASKGLRAQDQDRGPGVGDPKSATCNPNLFFVFGAGATKFDVCLSSEGNVIDLIAPAGFDHSGGYEGYRLCTPGGDYYDLGNEGQSGWAAPAVVQPKGPGKLPVTITRRTANLQWELKQTFAKDDKERDFTITMALKKLNGPIGATVYLQRWSDLNIDNDFGDDVADRSADSIYGRETRAMSLLALTYATSHNTGIGAYPYGRDSCTAATAAGPIPSSDPAGRVTYNLAGFNDNQTKTVKFRFGVQ